MLELTNIFSGDGLNLELLAILYTHNHDAIHNIIGEVGYSEKVTI